MLKKALFLLMVALCLSASAFAAPKNQSAPLLVGGNFSSHATPAPNAAVFNQAARNAEIARLNDLLRQQKFQEAIKRVNDLTAKNFVDNRFHLILAIAYDGLAKYEDVIYAAGQAIAVAPQDARAYILRAGAYLQQQNYERARLDADMSWWIRPARAVMKSAWTPC